MYYELVYTRCGEGIDIIKGGIPVKNSGFKVYSCSNEVLQEGTTDIQFLYNTAQSKQTYSDPKFMDDAYLYYVPDSGVKYFLNFHPIPFDRTATGGYSHRPGNFINQVFLGDFSEVYPYELFGNTSVWDAKLRGEAYYYENTPSPLTVRDNLADTLGDIGPDEISSFVSDGRREVLTEAISFILAQYALPPEERKFLVIKDEDSKTIELWIAAIESAFSPRMASGLSFATRLDKFVNSNKYTVNLNGQYQTQINLQSPNQKLRFRAMIVGVDERDRININAARPLPNSAFIVLDGKNRSLSVKHDASHPYYRFVTNYDDKHIFFCREFLQTINIDSPIPEIVNLFSAYQSILRFESSLSIEELLKSISILDKYQLLKTSYLIKLYSTVKKSISKLLKEDAVSTFTVLNWLEKVASIVGDVEAKESFNGIVCRSFADNVYRRPQSKSTIALWNAVLKSAFVNDALCYLLCKDTVNEYSGSLQGYAVEDWVAFSDYISKSLSRYREIPTTVSYILNLCLNKLYRTKDGKSALQIVSLFTSKDLAFVKETILSEAANSNNTQYISFLLQTLVRVAPQLSSTKDSIISFYKELANINKEEFINVVLEYKAQTIKSIREAEDYLDWILSINNFNSINLSDVFIAIDKMINIGDYTVGRFAYKIQENKPKAITCINSAHVCAVQLFEDKKIIPQLIKYLPIYSNQGFPSIENDSYVAILLDKLFTCKLPEDAFAELIVLISKTEYYSNKLVVEGLNNLGNRKGALLGKIIDIAAQIKSVNIYNALINECSELKPFEKSMNSIRNEINTRNGLQFFAQIEQGAASIIEQKKEPSLFGRLFSKGGYDPDNKRRRK